MMDVVFLHDELYVNAQEDLLRNVTTSLGDAQASERSLLNIHGFYANNDGCLC